MPDQIHIQGLQFDARKEFCYETSQFCTIFVHQPDLTSNITADNQFFKDQFFLRLAIWQIEVETFACQTV